MNKFTLQPTSLNKDLLIISMDFSEFSTFTQFPCKKGSKITVTDYDSIAGNIVEFIKISDTVHDITTGFKINNITNNLSSEDVVNDLITQDITKPLSAEMGVELNFILKKNRNNIVLFGDSRCQNEYAFIAGNGGGTYYYNRGVINWCNAYLGQRLNIFGYLGVGGDTYANLLARYDSDIRPLRNNVNYVYITCDINDVLADRTAFDIIYDINVLYGKILAAGFTIIDLCGYYPGQNAYTTSNMTDARLSVLNQINNYKKTLVNNLPYYILLDAALLLSNNLAVPPAKPTTPNNYLFDATTAAIHINVAAAQICGEKLAQILDPFVPKSDKLVTSVSDTTNTANGGNANNRNLVANSLFVSTPGTAGNGTGSANDTALDAGFTAGVAPTWTVRRNGTTCNIATSVGAASSGGVGFRQRMKVTGLANGSVAQLAPTTALTSQIVLGQVYKATAVVNISNPVDIHTVLLRFVYTIDGITRSSRYMADVSPANGTIKAGKWTLEVPSTLITGTTLTNFEVQILAIPTSTATAASCVLDVEQFSVSKL